MIFNGAVRTQGFSEKTRVEKTRVRRPLTRIFLQLHNRAASSRTEPVKRIYHDRP